MIEWPLNFNFETDDTCQNIFKPFIQSQMKRLEKYDGLRPTGHVYEFHLHSERVAKDVKATCEYMDLGNTVANNMYWATLPHDIGKMALPVALWDTKEKPDEQLKSKRLQHTNIGVDLVEQSLSSVSHPFKTLMMDIMLHHHEKMDGTGPHGAMGNKLTKPARLVAIADSFDGWSVKRPHFEPGRDLSKDGVIKRIKEEKGSEFFDMQLVKEFEGMKRRQT